MKNSHKEQKKYYSHIIRLIVFLSVIIIAIFIGDMFNLAETTNIHLRFDWAMIICTFLSAVATIGLGAVSLGQNKKLSEINEKSLEIAKINNGYSLIHFRKEQFIENKGKTLKLKLYDTKSIPLKHIIINQIKLQELSYLYVEKKVPKIILTNKKQTVNLEFTPINSDNKEEFYYANIDVNFPFEEYKKDMPLRLELDITITNVLGVSTTYEYYVLCRVTANNDNRIVLENYYEFNYCKSIEIIK